MLNIKTVMTFTKTTPILLADYPNLDYVEIIEKFNQSVLDNPDEFISGDGDMEVESVWTI